MSGKIRAVCCAALAGLALSGCAGGYAVRTEQAEQDAVIGDAVRLEATFCPAGDGGCAGAPVPLAPALPLAVGAGVQLLAGFLVSEDTGAPAAATAHLPGALGSGTATMLREPGMDAALALAHPAPSGDRWVGYRSAVLDPAAGGRELPSEAVPLTDDWSVAADVTIASGDAGLPVGSAFDHAAIGGVRVAALARSAPAAGIVDPADLRASRPLDCQDATTLCGPPSALRQLALRDLRGAGAPATIAAGASGLVAFTLRYVGDPGPTFALQAAIGLPGGSATPAFAALTPAAEGFQDVPVTVGVPADAAPGDYEVTLTAVAGSSRRVARAVVTVPGPESAAVADLRSGIDAPARALFSFLRRVELRGLEASGPAVGGRVALGDLLCHRWRGSCGPVSVTLAARRGRLYPAARHRGRTAAGLVVLGRVRLALPAQARRPVSVITGPGLARRLAGGELPAAVIVRSDPREPAVIAHLMLRRR